MVPSNPKSVGGTTKSCEGSPSPGTPCLAKFQPSRTTQRFCSARCRQHAWSQESGPRYFTGAQRRIISGFLSSNRQGASALRDDLNSVSTGVSVSNAPEGIRETSHDAKVPPQRAAGTS